MLILLSNNYNNFNRSITLWRFKPKFLPPPAPIHPEFNAAFYNRTDRAVTAIEEMLPFVVEMIAERKAAKEREKFSFNKPSS